MFTDVVCRPPASLFLKKRKRKRTGSDGSDVEMTITPPGSPAAADDSNVSGCQIVHGLI